MTQLHTLTDKTSSNLRFKWKGSTMPGAETGERTYRDEFRRMGVVKEGGGAVSDTLAVATAATWLNAETLTKHSVNSICTHYAYATKEHWC